MFPQIPKSPKKPDWVVIFTTYDVTEAHIVSGRLTHEGIRNFVHTQAGASAMGIHIGALGVVDVLVSPEDAELAMSILSDEVDVLPDGDDDSYYAEFVDDDDE